MPRGSRSSKESSRDRALKLSSGDSIPLKPNETIVETPSDLYRPLVIDQQRTKIIWDYEVIFLLFRRNPLLYLLFFTTAVHVVGSQMMKVYPSTRRIADPAFAIASMLFGLYGWGVGAVFLNTATNRLTGGEVPRERSTWERVPIAILEGLSGILIFLLGEIIHNHCAKLENQDPEGHCKNVSDNEFLTYFFASLAASIPYIVWKSISNQAKFNWSYEKQWKKYLFKCFDVITDTAYYSRVLQTFLGLIYRIQKSWTYEIAAIPVGCGLSLVESRWPQHQGKIQTPMAYFQTTNLMIILCQDLHNAMTQQNDDGIQTPAPWWAATEVAYLSGAGLLAMLLLYWKTKGKITKIEEYVKRIERYIYVGAPALLQEQWKREYQAQLALEHEKNPNKAFREGVAIGIKKGREGLLSEMIGTPDRGDFTMLRAGSESEILRDKPHVQLGEFIPARPLIPARPNSDPEEYQPPHAHLHDNALTNIRVEQVIRETEEKKIELGPQQSQQRLHFQYPQAARAPVPVAPAPAALLPPPVRLHNLPLLNSRITPSMLTCSPDSPSPLGGVVGADVAASAGSVYDSEDSMGSASSGGSVKSVDLGERKEEKSNGESPTSLQVRRFDYPPPAPVASRVIAPPPSTVPAPSATTVPPPPPPKKKSCVLQ